jgi:ATP-binding cassette subfamily B protein
VLTNKFYQDNIEQQEDETMASLENPNPVQQKTKPKTGMARLLELAATKKPLVVSSIILACLAAIASFIPYIAIYLVIWEILGAWPDVGALNTALLFRKNDGQIPGVH